MANKFAKEEYASLVISGGGNKEDEFKEPGVTVSEMIDTFVCVL